MISGLRIRSGHRPAGHEQLQESNLNPTTSSPPAGSKICNPGRKRGCRMFCFETTCRSGGKIRGRPANPYIPACVGKNIIGRPEEQGQQPYSNRYINVDLALGKGVPCINKVITGAVQHHRNRQYQVEVRKQQPEGIVAFVYTEVFRETPAS